jgi:hypothetical protein
VFAVLLAAAVGGGVLGLVMARDSGDDVTSDDEQTETSAADTTEPPSTVATTAADTVAPTTAPDTTTPDTTTPDTTTPDTVPATNPLGVALGQPANPSSVLPEERFVAALGVSTDQALPGTPAFVGATWWVLANQRAMPLTWVASPKGFTHTNILGGRVEYQNFVVTDGKVSNATFCVLRPDGSDERCRQIADVVSVVSQRVPVAQTPLISLSTWARVTLPDNTASTLFTYTSNQPISAMASAEIPQIDFNGSTVVLTGRADVAVANVVITYADGSQETVPVTLTCCG